jgi:transcriptional regulator with XRE-family HTH domain
MRLGPRLRLLRQRLRVSLRELSEQTGFSASFLSLVENDKASPSVASLERIAAAFGLSLAEFFQENEALPYRVVRTSERQTYTSEWSKTVVEVLAQQPTGGALFPLILRMEPGARSGKRPRAALTEEFALLQEGQIVLVTPDGEEELGPGDTVTLAAGTARLWENRSSEPAILLVLGHRANPVRPFVPEDEPETNGQPEPVVPVDC